MKLLNMNESKLDRIIEVIQNKINKKFEKISKLDKFIVNNFRCSMEKEVRKKYVMNGDLVDFHIDRFYFSEESMSIEITLSYLEWYRTKDEECLSVESFVDDVDVDLAKADVDKELLLVDLSKVKTNRKKACDEYQKNFEYEFKDRLNEQPHIHIDTNLLITNDEVAFDTMEDANKQDWIMKL